MHFIKKSSHIAYLTANGITIPHYKYRDIFLRGKNKRFFHLTRISLKKQFFIIDRKPLEVSDFQFFHFCEFLNFLTYKQLTILKRNLNISLKRNPSKQELIAAILDAIQNQCVSDAPLFMAWLDNYRFFVHVDPEKRRPDGKPIIFNRLNQGYQHYTFSNLVRLN